MNNINSYPKVGRRIQALMIDSLIVPVAAIGGMMASSEMGLTGKLAATTALVIVFLLEPFLVSFKGGTVGHYLMGIEVRSSRTGGRINIFLATIRFIVKFILGIFSIVSIYITRKHQAIHDKITGTIVVLRNPDALPNSEVLKERTVDESGYEYPPWWLRLLMMLLYSAILFMSLGISVVFLVSDSCMDNNICSSMDNVIAAVLNLIFLVGVVTIIVLCSKGIVWGCRRKKIQDNANS